MTKKLITYNNDLLKANFNYHKLDKAIILSIINYVNLDVNLYKHYNNTYNNQKYSLELLLYELIDIIKHGKVYRSSKIIPKSTLNDAYIKLTKLNIIKNTYIQLLTKYLKKSPVRKLKCCYTDTTSCVNKHGRDKVKYNGRKKRNVTNISLVTCSKGVPIKITVNNGSDHDSKIFIKDMSEPYLIENIDRYIKYLLADGAYDSLKIRKLIESKNAP